MQDVDLGLWFRYSFWPPVRGFCVVSFKIIGIAVVGLAVLGFIKIGIMALFG